MATREYQFIVGPETSTLPTIGSPSASTDLITLGFADSNYTQGKQSVADITALKAVTNTGDGARADGDVIEVQSINSIYVFDAGSAATGNDDTIVEPTTGTGRWLKVAQAISVSTDNRLPKFDGVGGALQTSGITVDDSNNVTGVNDLTVTGDLTVNGTTTTLNTQTLDVEDANITTNKGGNDASSEGSGLTIDRTGTKGSLIYAAAAASKFKIGNLASEVEVVDISTAQTLTNKTIAYASNTLTGVQPVSTLTTKGDLYVATAASTVTRQGVGADGQFLVADSSQTNGVKWATANSGSKNYFQFNSFENNATTGWSLGSVTLTTNFPSGAPTFGSGASGNLSLSTVSGSPIAGTYALSYASSTITTEGNFVASDAFTIDAEDQAKVLSFKFSYKAQTNPSNANWSGTTSNSFGVAIYDVTNSVWIQPAGCFNLVQSSGVGIASGTFQTSSNGTSYRLCVYNANATSGAVTVYFDSFFVGPQITAAGAAVSDWVSYTPTGGWTGAVTYNGKWRRVGDSMEIIAQVSCSGAPTGTNPTINLPSGFTIDITKLATDTSREPMGLAVFVDAGVQTYRGAVFLNTTTSVMPVAYGVAGTYANDAVASTTTPFTFGASDIITVEFKAPIVGWSSNTVMSSDTDTRVVSFAGLNSSTQSVTANTTNIAVTATKDSHGAWSGSVYTIPVSGDYVIAITSADTAASVNFRVYIDGSANNYLFNAPTNAYTSGSMLVPNLRAGQTLSIRTGTTGTLVAGTSISISRLSGPATIAASEAVIVSASDASGTVISTGTTGSLISFGTEVKDTHGAYASGIFTAPVSGEFEVSAMVQFSANSTGYRGVKVLKNNVDYRYLGLNGTPSATNGCAVNGNTTITLLAGETLKIYAEQTSGGNLALIASGLSNWVTIKRVGN